MSFSWCSILLLIGIIPASSLHVWYLVQLECPVNCRLQVLKQSIGIPTLALVRRAVKMYIVDVQYFQVLPFLYSSFFDHKSHKKRLPLVYLGVLIIENWHMYFIFEKGRDGCGVAIALCHVIDCKKIG